MEAILLTQTIRSSNNEKENQRFIQGPCTFLFRTVYFTWYTQGQTDKISSNAKSQELFSTAVDSIATLNLGPYGHEKFNEHSLELRKSKDHPFFEPFVKPQTKKQNARSENRTQYLQLMRSELDHYATKSSAFDDYFLFIMIAKLFVCIFLTCLKNKQTVMTG